MKEDNKTYIIIICVMGAIILGLVYFCFFSDIFKDYKNTKKKAEGIIDKVTEKMDEQLDKKSENDNTSTNQKINFDTVTYTLTFKDNAPEGKKGEAPSSLTLKEDGTFKFNANMCRGVLEITGNYSINNNVIVLENLTAHEDFKSMIETNLRGKSTLEFSIVSENEIYLVNPQFSCVYSGNEYGSFIKQ